MPKSIESFCNIAKSILEKVGGTPLVEISNKLNKGENVTIAR